MKSLVSCTDLPPEILEKIFHYLSSDLDTCIRVSQVCHVFRSVISRVPVLITIPLVSRQSRWLQQFNVPVRYLYNCEISAYVSDQIVALNLNQLKVAKLVGYDYQSRKCEVTQHYLQIVQFIRRKASSTLKRFELNVDLSKGRRSFKFAEILTQFTQLRSLSIHFSAHIELNQRILNSDAAQNLIDILLSNLPNLKTFNIFICPQRRLHIKSRSLQEFGIFKSDAIEMTRLDLPNLAKLNIHENTIEMFRKIMADRETSGTHLHKNLLSLVYDGCPNLRVINHLRLSPDLCPPNRPDRKIWTRNVNRLLIKQYKFLLMQENMPKSAATLQ